MYIYIYCNDGTYRLRLVKHSMVKGCTNIYCVIDFAAKPSTGSSSFDFPSGPWPFLFPFPFPPVFSFSVFIQRTAVGRQWESGGANIKYHPARIRSNKREKSEGLAGWLDVKFNFTQGYWMAKDPLFNFFFCIIITHNNGITEMWAWAVITQKPIKQKNHIIINCWLNIPITKLFDLILLK